MEEEEDDDDDDGDEILIEIQKKLGVHTFFKEINQNNVHSMIRSRQIKKLKAKKLNFNNYFETKLYEDTKSIKNKKQKSFDDLRIASLLQPGYFLVNFYQNQNAQQEIIPKLLGHNYNNIQNNEGIDEFKLEDSSTNYYPIESVPTNNEIQNQVNNNEFGQELNFNKNNTTNKNMSDNNQSKRNNSRGKLSQKNPNFKNKKPNKQIFSNNFQSIKFFSLINPDNEKKLKNNSNSNLSSGGSIKRFSRKNNKRQINFLSFENKGIYLIEPKFQFENDFKQINKDLETWLGIGVFVQNVFIATPTNQNYHKGQIIIKKKQLLIKSKNKTIFSSNWGNHLKIFIENTDLRSMYFLNTKNVTFSISLRTKDICHKRIIILLFLIFNESKGKHKKIGLNEPIDELNINHINTRILPQLSTPKKELKQALITFKSYRVWKKKNTQNFSLENWYNYLEKKPLVILPVFFLIKKKIPFTPGFVHVKRQQLDLYNEKKIFQQILYNFSFNLITNIADNKIFQITTKLYQKGHLEQKHDISLFFVCSKTKEKELYTGIISHFYHQWINMKLSNNNNEIQNTRNIDKVEKKKKKKKKKKIISKSSQK